MVKCYIECGSTSLRSLIVQVFNKNKLNLVCFRPKAGIKIRGISDNMITRILDNINKRDIFSFVILLTFMKG